MAWDGSNYEPVRLVLHGGDVCPLCQRGTLCLNGLASHKGEKIVICSDCRETLCARCGQPTFPTGQSFLGTARHICVQCLGHLEVFLADFPDGEWITLSRSEVFANGRPKSESEIISLARQKSKAGGS